MLNKETKREMKRTRKIIAIFLGICIPVMFVLTCLLYFFVPTIQQWVVIALIVVFGLILYFGVMAIMNRKAQKDAEKPKKYDPFSD